MKKPLIGSLTSTLSACRAAQLARRLPNRRTGDRPISASPPPLKRVPITMFCRAGPQGRKHRRQKGLVVLQVAVDDRHEWGGANEHTLNHRAGEGHGAQRDECR